MIYTLPDNLILNDRGGNTLRGGVIEDLYIVVSTSIIIK